MEWMEKGRTYLDVAPHLWTERAAVYVDANGKPRSTVRRCHAVEQCPRLRGCLDAMQAHVAPEFDGQSELRFEDGQLVRKED